MEKYLHLKNLLTDEQQQLLIDLVDESSDKELEQYEKGLNDGKRQGLKIAIEKILKELAPLDEEYQSCNS